MQYEIVGSNMQHLSVTLEEGDSIYADSGALVSKNENIIMTPRMAGGIISALERKAAGAQAMLTEFKSKSGSGKFAVAGVFPGKIMQIKLAEGQKFTVEQLSFLAAETTVDYKVHVMGFGAAVLGQAGFVLLELTGPGSIFIHVVGDIGEYDITMGNPIEVDPGHVAGFDSNLKYTFRSVDNIRTAMFGGVGLFLAAFEGQGRLITHSVSRYKLAREVYITAMEEQKKD